MSAPRRAAAMDGRDRDLDPIRLYTPAQVAELWGCCETSVRKFIKAGELRCVSLHTERRVTYDELRRFIATMGLSPAARRRSLREVNAKHPTNR